MTGNSQNEFENANNKFAIELYHQLKNQKIEFMNKTMYLNYFENNDMQALTIPYKDINKAFCIILPIILYLTVIIYKYTNYEF
jgi:serine protease inhibitor